MIRPTVTFWHSLRTSGMQMMNHLQKLLYGMWCYFVCIMANTKVF